MLLIRSLFIFSCTITSVIQAIPINSNPTYNILETNHVLTESLSEYYEGIVDQILLDVSENILSHIPLSIGHGNVNARQLAQKSMDRNLNFMRASLLASVNPLVSTDIPLIPGFQTIEEDGMFSLIDDRAPFENELSSVLLESILILNKKMSHQLGLIVNAEKSCSIMMKQANSNSYHVQKQQFDEETTTITVEWKLLKPFQINIIREEHETDNDISKETEWLYEQLIAIEYNLLDEFNDRIDEAVQIIKDSLVFDI